VTGPEGIALGPQSTLAITLYGFDSRVADAAATVIRTARIELAALPSDATITLPTDARERIADDTGPLAEGDASYYLVVDLDVDGDDMICPGDLNDDVDEIGIFGSEGPGGPLAMPMKVVDAARGCLPLVPNDERD